MTTGPDVEPAAWVATLAAGFPALVRGGGPAGPDQAVAAEPLIVAGPAGPVLSMVVVLDRQPTTDLSSVGPLVRSGALSMDVAIGLPDDAVAALVTAGARPPERLFADPVTYTLTTARGPEQAPGAARVLATASASGPQARAALSVTLGRDDTVDVLGALRGQPSLLRVGAGLVYADGAAPATLGLRASWAEVHDALARHAGQDGTVRPAAVRAAVVDLLADGRLLVSGAPAGRIDPDVVAGILLAQSAIVLDRADDALWKLRARPDPAFPFDHVTRTALRRKGRLDLHAGLDAVLAPAMTGRSLDEVVSLVAPQQGAATGVGPVAPRRRSVRGPVPGPAEETQVRLARDGTGLASLAVLAEPRRPGTPTAMFIAAAAARPAATPITHLPLDDLRVLPLRPEREPLPVIDDPLAAVWRDAADKRVVWYAPDVELMLPPPDTAADTSPFLFRFRRTGVTDDVRPALEGSVVLTVRRTTPPGALMAAGLRTLREVPLDGVSATLEVPFVDRTDGIAKTQSLTGTVRPTAEGWSIEVPVINDGLRLAYRALSAADPAAPPAVLRLDYTFAAYSPIRRKELQLAFAGKTAVTPIAFSRPVPGTVRQDPVFDPAALALRSGRTDVAFRRERAEAAVPTGAGRPGGTVAVLPRTAARMPIGGTVFAEPPDVVLPPKVRPAPLPGGVQAEDPQLVRRTIARRVTVPAAVPCATLGAFYRETTGGTDTAVGCLPELQLGEVRYTLFSPVRELSGERVRVHRLLQQPGRFLLSPAAYGITRHEADEGDRAYRPCVVLYGVLDSDDPAGSRIVLDATLQPDLAAHELDELRVRLAALAADPIVELPTEIDGVRAEFTWAIPGAHSSHATVVLPGGLIRVSIETDLSDWMLMRLQLQKSFFSGTAEFHYPDGASHRSALVLDLTRVLGPWGGGPVEATVAGGTAWLRNRVERAVDVARLMCTGSQGRVPVEVGAGLPGGGTIEVPVPAGTTDAVPVVSLPRSDPVVIEETRSFIDQIETNVLFVSLVDLAGRGLARLGIQAQLRGVDGECTVQLTDATPTGEARFVLPLTSYLARRVLQYRVTRHPAGSGQAAETGEWLEWDLARQGNVISLSWAPGQPAPGEQ